MRKAIAFVAGFALGAWLCAWAYWLVFVWHGMWQYWAVFWLPIYLVGFAFCVGLGSLFARLRK